MKTFLIATALSAAGLAGPAAADPDLKRRDVAVNVADLDLTTSEGRATLDRRIEKAVLKACGTAHYLEAEKLADLDKCRAEARDRAEAVRASILVSSPATAGEGDRRTAVEGPRLSKPVLSLSNGPAGGAVIQ